MQYKINIVIILMAISFVAGSVDELSSKMIKISAGSFIMGHDAKLSEVALPKHEVQVNSFYIDKYEVTQGDYEKLMGMNPSATEERLLITEKLKDNEYVPTDFAVPVGENYPVTDVTWYDAARYCNARSRDEGLEPCYDEETWECDFTKNGYRLPTEAEWEYACRAGSNAEFFWGDDKSKIMKYQVYWLDYPTYFEQYWSARVEEREFVWDKPYPVMLPVGQRKPNPWGLYDILGNASEWCNDWYDDNYYKTSPRNNPKGPEKGIYKVFRGGSYRDFGKCGVRLFFVSSKKADSIGFRCVRNAPKDEKAEEKPVEPKRDDKEEKKE